MVRFNEEYAAGAESKIIPNAVQHNIPAWTIFAMFFIVIPLAGNIIKERESGMALRLRTMPGSNLPVILGKSTVYFIVGLFQAFFMILIGVAVMPLFGMPALVIEGGTLPLLLIAISVSLAASGYGVLIGTIATSQEQSSIFGSISVVILAAIGGVWVPTFMMSDLMVSLSKTSPLNWGLNAFYEVFLRNAGVADVLLNILLLLVFFIVCISISWVYNQLKTN
jgi:ABC-2 type transport system permease protein